MFVSENIFNIGGKYYAILFTSKHVGSFSWNTVQD
jgi:hypothetical protein